MATQPDEAHVVAVVDTNVLLDLYSCHDYSRTADRLGVDGVEHSDAVYRRARVRESLLLAMHLHNGKATTFSHGDEGIDLAVRNVPPEAVDTFELHFTTLFVHFVKDELLGDWQVAVKTEPNRTRGNDADAFLLEYAREHQVPLITNEGYTASGISVQKMRKKAIEAGVTVVTPREFWAQNIDEATEVRRFLEAFATRAPGYIARDAKPDLVRRSLTDMYGYFRHVLLGHTDGREQPVRVTL